AAAAAAPANAELQMKLGAACHRSGKLEESYRAFMKAAAEFKNRGDDCAALDAYGRAVKAALSGAEAGGALTETMSESGVEENGITRIVPGPSLHQIQAPPFLELISRAESAASSGGLVRAQRPKDDSTSRDESSDDDPVAGKIATAEILFG